MRFYNIGIILDGCKNMTLRIIQMSIDGFITRFITCRVNPLERYCDDNGVLTKIICIFTVNSRYRWYTSTCFLTNMQLQEGFRQLSIDRDRFFGKETFNRLLRGKRTT